MERPQRIGGAHGLKPLVGLARGHSTVATAADSVPALLFPRYFIPSPE